MPMDMTGISLYGGSRECEIRFNTNSFSTSDSMISKVQKKISGENLDVTLDSSSFGDGILTLVIGTAIRAAYAVRDLLFYILGLLDAARV